MIKNLEKINVIKRDKVQKGCEYLQKMNGSVPIVRKMVVFGSSVTDNCLEESDIDICLYSDYSAENLTFFQIFGELPLIMNDICDILLASKIKGDIVAEIDKKGVVVYEYKNHLS